MLIVVHLENVLELTAIAWKAGQGLNAIINCVTTDAQNMDNVIMELVFVCKVGMDDIAL